MSKTEPRYTLIADALDRTWDYADEPAYIHVWPPEASRSGIFGIVNVVKCPDGAEYAVPI